jgi:hypothetical protein
MPIPESLFFVVFAGFAAYFVYRYVKYGGFRGALYGSAIVRTVGEVELSGSSSTTTTLHGYPMTVGNAGELVELLQQARMG